MEEIKLSTNNKNLRSTLPLLIGKAIQFDNGCWLFLKEELGIFFGQTPYGTEWGCNANSAWIDTILNWLEYWDTPRNEQGVSMQ